MTERKIFLWRVDSSVSTLIEKEQISEVSGIGLPELKINYRLPESGVILKGFAVYGISLLLFCFVFFY